MQDPGAYGVASYPDTIDFEEYRIRIDDRLYIRVYSTDAKTAALFNGGMESQVQQQIISHGGGVGSGYDLYTYQVYNDSTIDFPTLGKVKVHGMTTREVKHMLEKELTGYVAQEEGFSNISVEVTMINRYFSVIGPQQSGRFAIPKEKMTIFEALAAAGDISDFGDKQHIAIVRQIEGKTQVKQFDIRSKEIINSEFYYIEPNDVIYIRNRKGYSFGLTSLPTVISLTASTISFGAFLYVFINSYIVTPIVNGTKE